MRELLSVLIVDDELPLRQELRLFPWEEHGFELAGEAENGDEALHFCRDFLPDIVITDITMPVMDGMELFRSLRAELPATQVILLTCHSEFAYAREALKLGAVEYLEKVALDEADLAAALRKAKEAFDRERAIRRSAEEKRRREQAKSLTRLAKGSGDGREAAEWLQAAFGVALPMRLAALHVETKAGDRLLVSRELEEALGQPERPRFPFAWLPAEDGVYMLIALEEALRQPAGELRGQLEAALAWLGGELDRRLPFLSDAIRLYAVVSEPVRRPDDFAGVYAAVTREHPQRFYDAASRVFIAGAASSAAEPDAAALAAMRERLRTAGRDRAKLAELLGGELPRWAAKLRIGAEALRVFALDWLREWQRENGAAGRAAAAAKAVAAARTAAELAAALVHEVEAAAGAPRKLRKEIADAKAYIAANLEKPITLVVVAEQVGLSPHYLSRLFREETGISFNDYITKRRIDRAVHLLQTTSLRVYEVASAVGIPSYRYFSATFRDYTGAAPTDYKKG